MKNLKLKMMTNKIKTDWIGNTQSVMATLNSGRYTEWWVFALIIVCGLTALMQLPKLYKWVKCFF